MKMKEDSFWPDIKEAYDDDVTDAAFDGFFPRKELEKEMKNKMATKNEELVFCSSRLCVSLVWILKIN